MNNSYGTPAGGYGEHPGGHTFPGHVAPQEAAAAGGAPASPSAASSQAAGSPGRRRPAGARRPLSAPPARPRYSTRRLIPRAPQASPAGSTAPARRARWALARLRLIGGVDGQFTFHNKTGFHTLAFEHGTIQSVSGSDVVIKAADGTTWTWMIVSDTVVRKGGSKTTTSALAAGESVFAGGPVVSGAKDARLIVIRASGTSGASGSDSAQTSLS